jgi:dienelactone hydrolase
MRALELTLVLLCAACTIGLASAGRTIGMPRVHGTRLLLAVVLVSQILLEGWRWQMFPAYAAALVIIAGAPYLLGIGAQGLFCAAIVNIGLLVTSTGACLVLPFIESPPPHGAFQVGITTIAVAVSRPPEAVLDEMKAQPLVKLWYPANADSQDSGSFLARRMGEHFRATPRSWFVSEASPAHSSSKFPVIVYFDGWPEDEVHNVNLIVELVSHGFAIASVQYPARLPGTSPAADALLRAQLARDLVSYSSDEAFGRSVELNHQRARIHASDATAVLDALTALDNNASGRFAGRLNTQRAGTMGFSFGGGIAAEASRLDSRIKAVFNMDGRHWGESLYTGVNRPYLLITEDLPMPTRATLTSRNGLIRYEAILDQVDFPNLEANLRSLGGIHVVIFGAAHMNFTDVALRSPLRHFSEGGTIDARRAQRIVQTYAVEFFTRYLLSDLPPPLDAAWPKFPEAKLQAWPTPGALPSG